MSKKLLQIFLILLIAAISFSPRFSLGIISLTKRNIDIRVEDILIFAGLFGWIIYFLASGKYTIKKPPLFWPIVSWLIFGCVSILINFLLKEVNMEVVFFYFLKEIEFFSLYFLLFGLLENLQIGSRVLRYWFFCMTLNIGWLVYVFLYQVQWSIYYGPETFMEPQGPFPSGGYFLILFVFSFNLFMFYFRMQPISLLKKAMLFVLCMVPALGVISSGSRTAFIGLFVALLLSAAMYFFTNMSIAKLFTSLVVLMLVALIFVQMIYAFNIQERLTSFSYFLKEYRVGVPDSRLFIFEENLTRIIHDPLILIVGLGVKGEAHSQYMRVFLERGIVGLFLFGWLMWSILRVAYKNFRHHGEAYVRALSIGLFVATIAMLVMAIPNDVFMVVKIDEVYWSFVAITMVAILAPQSKLVPSNER